MFVRLFMLAVWSVICDLLCWKFLAVLFKEEAVKLKVRERAGTVNNYTSPSLLTLFAVERKWLFLHKNFMLTFHSRDECALMCSGVVLDGAVSKRGGKEEKRRIVQLIWNTFYIFAFFHSFAQRPLKWFSFMYVVIRKWGEMCSYYKLCLECARVTFASSPPLAVVYNGL